MNHPLSGLSSKWSLWVLGGSSFEEAVELLLEALAGRPDEA